MTYTISSFKDKTLVSIKNLDPVNLAMISTAKSTNEKRRLRKDHLWARVEEPLSTLILMTFLDPTKKKILNATSQRLLTIPQILDACNISHTVGYRKINSLMQDNLLVSDGYTLRNYKKIRTFKSILEDVRISIDKNKILVKVKFTKN